MRLLRRTRETHVGISWYFLIYDMMGLKFCMFADESDDRYLATYNNKCTGGKQNEAVNKGVWQEQLKCTAPKMF